MAFSRPTYYICFLGSPNMVAEFLINMFSKQLLYRDTSAKKQWLYASLQK